MKFKDRVEAGEKLAAALQKFAADPDAVVVALPRGGVVPGAIVAKALGKPLDLVIPRKIGAPGNPEYAIGAVTESGEGVWNEEERERADPTWLQCEIEKEQAEAKRRRETYLVARKRIDLAGKTVILVDDGIATGITMRAAIQEVRKAHPKKIVVAVPVAPPDSVSEMKSLIDEVVVLATPMLFGAIGAFYKEFPQLEDVEVTKLLKEL
jgi:predicted phosphoribosyltransferase